MRYATDQYRLGYAVEFILDNEKPDDKLSNDFRGEYIACYADGEIVGVIGFRDMNKTRRIKMVIAKDGFRTKTVYHHLINAAAKTEKIVTVFGPENVYRYFKSCGFKTISINKNNIYFMKKESGKEDEKSSL